MRLTSVQLRDFRSYSSLEVDFSPGPNVLIGPNGVGKTNLAEAVYYCSVLHSHRVAADSPLIASGCDQAVIRTTVIDGTSEFRLDVAINAGRANRLQVSGVAARSREFAGRLMAVCFAPEDLHLVKGDPAVRRTFIDDVLTTRAPRYVAVKADYERVLKQRNSLLKSLAKSRLSGTVQDWSTLEVWDEQLASHGAQLLFGRLSVLDEFRDHLVAAYSELARGDTARVEYVARGLGARGESDVALTDPAIDRDDLELRLRTAISVRQPEEIARGITVVGPHRDELHFTINELPARTHASHGESWSLALALKLANLGLLRQTRLDASDPVLILDDVFAELDASRRESLVKASLTTEQVLITAAVEADVPLELLTTVFEVTPGQAAIR